MVRRPPLRHALRPPRLDLASLALVASLGLLAPATAAGRPALPIGGVLTVSEPTWVRWAWSGRWRFPVGDARDFREPGDAREPAFRLLRGVGDPDEGQTLHQGVDLGCGHGGSPVRAAAGGVVLLAHRTIGTSGYGRYVVIGHRLPEGGMAFSVYAHLAPNSIPVHAGEFVTAGTRIGRVGRSGHATTPHLHFEIRLAGSPGLRWEKEEVVDPIAFIDARAVEPCAADSLGDYLEWAQYTGLLDGAEPAAGDLRRSVWWHMLAVAGRDSLDSLPRNAAGLADSLTAAGLLSGHEAGSPEGPVTWSDMAHDLARLHALGIRLPPRPLLTPRHRAACRRWLGDPHPSDVIRSGRAARSPTIAAALLALADLAPAREPPRPASHPAKSAGARSRPRGSAAHRARADSSTARGNARPATPR